MWTRERISRAVWGDQVNNDRYKVSVIAFFIALAIFITAMALGT